MVLFALTIHTHIYTLSTKKRDALKVEISEYSEANRVYKPMGLTPTPLS